MADEDNVANNPDDEQFKNMPALRKTAIFLMNLEKEDAAEILRHLDQKEVQSVAEAMASLTNVSKAELDYVMRKFLEEIEEQTKFGLNNEDYIRQMMIEALGEDKANAFLDRILASGETKGLDTLKWMDPRSVADLIKAEHPQIQSLILSHLDGQHAADIMMQLDSKLRLEIMMRIAQLEGVQPNALVELNKLLEKNFTGGSSSQARPMGGLKTAAGIMNFLESSTSEQLMEDIKDKDVDMGQNISELMFVFENILDIDDRGVQTMLRDVPNEMLLLALKGADGEVKEKIFTNMSKRAAPKSL